MLTFHEKIKSRCDTMRQSRENASAHISQMMSIVGDNEDRDYARNMAFFLKYARNTIYGQWSGYISASDQRRLFGRYLGKGRITIDGKTETVRYTVKVCFGQDWDTTTYYWREF